MRGTKSRPSDIRYSTWPEPAASYMMCDLVCVSSMHRQLRENRLSYPTMAVIGP